MDIVTTQIYESYADNAFAKVATIAMDPGGGGRGAVVCNVDGAGPEEYLLRSGPGIRVFRAVAPAAWECVGIAYGVGGHFYPYDLNRNGIPEIVWQYTTTRVFEHPGIPTDAHAEPPWRTVTLDVVPNPCRARAILRPASGAESVARLAIFDVRGRIVERRDVASGRPILWQPLDLPAGVYLVRLEDAKGRVLASGRGTLLR
jgi:hypothetical protein